MKQQNKEISKKEYKQICKEKINQIKETLYFLFILSKNTNLNSNLAIFSFLFLITLFGFGSINFVLSINKQIESYEEKSEELNLKVVPLIDLNQPLSSIILTTRTQTENNPESLKYEPNSYQLLIREKLEENKNNSQTNNPINNQTNNPTENKITTLNSQNTPQTDKKDDLDNKKRITPIDNKREISYSNSHILLTQELKNKLDLSIIDLFKNNKRNIVIQVIKVSEQTEDSNIYSSNTKNNNIQASLTKIIPLFLASEIIPDELVGQAKLFYRYNPKEKSLSITTGNIRNASLSSEELKNNIKNLNSNISLIKINKYILIDGELINKEILSQYLGLKVEDLTEELDTSKLKYFRDNSSKSNLRVISDGFKISSNPIFQDLWLDMSYSQSNDKNKLMKYLLPYFDETLNLEDGSGLSRNNSIPIYGLSRLMAKIFYNLNKQGLDYNEIRNLFANTSNNSTLYGRSLPEYVFGKTGTLSSLTALLTCQQLDLKDGIYLACVTSSVDEFDPLDISFMKSQEDRIHTSIHDQIKYLIKSNPKLK